MVAPTSLRILGRSLPLAMAWCRPVLTPRFPPGHVRKASLPLLQATTSDGVKASMLARMSAAVLALLPKYPRSTSPFELAGLAAPRPWDVGGRNFPDSEAYVDYELEEPEAPPSRSSSHFDVRLLWRQSESCGRVLHLLCSQFLLNVDQGFHVGPAEPAHALAWDHLLLRAASRLPGNLLSEGLISFSKRNQPPSSPRIGRTSTSLPHALPFCSL